MHGKLVYEAHGKVVRLKRMPEGKIEETLEMQGTFLGEEFSGSYKVEGKARKDGTGFIETHGEVIINSGEPIHFSGIANGITSPDGRTELRGANCFSCSSGKFAILNEIAVIWKAEVDEAGVVRSKGWEWK